MSKTPSAASLALMLWAGCIGDVVPPADERANGSSGSSAESGNTEATPSGRTTPGADGESSPAGPENPVVGPSAPGGGAGGEAGCAPGQEPLASGVRIREVAFYQTVKVPVVEDGRWVSDREAPLVQGKESLARVFVESLTGSAPNRRLRVNLTLHNGEDATAFEGEMVVSAASLDERVDSTFNFNVPGELLRDETALSVSLRETTCTAESGAASDARFPPSQTQPLQAIAVGKLRVVVVPVRVLGITPLVTPQQVEAIRATMAAYYPVPDVEVSTRAPLVWDEPLANTGAGWDALLDEIGALRQRDQAARDVYYYGLVTPELDFSSFCRGACIVGLAPQAVFASSVLQFGLGIGYDNELTYDTMVHELGHVHGLGHAPCVSGGEISGVDRAFPFADGATGGWGWDARTNSLKAPTAKDIMGYCTPTWIGSYNYVQLVERSLTVNAAAQLQLTEKRGAGARWRSIILQTDGSARWGRMTPDEWPGGSEEVATVLGQNGAPLRDVIVSRVTLAEAQSSFLYIPQPEADWMALELEDRTLILAQIQ